jgi:hypothetical protein
MKLEERHPLMRRDGPWSVAGLTPEKYGCRRNDGQRGWGIESKCDAAWGQGTNDHVLALWQD